MKTYKKLMLVAGFGLMASPAFADCKKLPLVVSDQYEYAGCVENGLATVTQNGKEGIVNTQGQVIVPVRYDTANASSDGTPLASVCLYDKCGFMNTQTGKLVIPMKYKAEERDEGWEAYEFKEGLSAVAIGEGENSSYGFINTLGNTTIPFEYKYARNFSQGLAAVSKNDKWGFINKANQIIIPLEYDYVGNFGSGLAPVRKNDKAGFINQRNQLVIPYGRYDVTESFSEGLAAVHKTNENGNTKIGFINPQGIEVIPLRFDSGDYTGDFEFKNGTVMIFLDGVQGTLDRAGKFTPDPHQTEEPVE